MEPISTPRVSSRQLDTFVGKNVLVVGNVIQLRGEVALLETDGQVTCLLNRVSLVSLFLSLERYLWCLGCMTEKDFWREIAEP